MDSCLFLSSLNYDVFELKLSIYSTFHKVSHKELQEQTIKFTVIDNGRLRKRQIIGHLLCSLKHISIEDGKQVFSE